MGPKVDINCNYKKENGKIQEVTHNRRIHNFFYGINHLLPIEKRLSDAEIEEISDFLNEEVYPPLKY